MPNADSRDYDVGKAWPTTEPVSADDCIKTLFDLSFSKQASAFHGAYRNWGRIVSSLDLHFEKIKMPNRGAWQKTETKLLESFANDADPHLLPGARGHIEWAHWRWRTWRTTRTLYVGRHHGLPTRCVDWTSNYLTALFFACRRDFSRDGVVWWMNNDNFTKALEHQWPRVYGKEREVEDDIEKDFIDGTEKDVLVRLSYPPFMERAHRQDAWITLSLKYGVHHDAALFRLGVCLCGRLVVKASLKRELLNRLDRLGVNGSSLGLGGGCVELIAADVAKSVEQDRAGSMA